MDKLKHKGIIGLILALLFGGGAVAVTDLGGIRDSGCKNVTQSVVDVGNEESLEILATTSNRALARLERLNFSGDGNDTLGTTTPWLAFTNGGAATSGEGIPLYASSTKNFIEFGRNTIFPYIGSVTVITDTASTSLLLTVCDY